MTISFNYNSNTFPIVYFSLCLLLYSYQRIEFNLSKESTIENISTSVWCQSTRYGYKKCSFNNLCYNLESDFLFVLTDKSIFSGVIDRKDLTKIKTSSISNHSEFYLKMAVVSSSHNLLQSIIYFHNPVFAVARFKPDNIMHVIHDDLLPLFKTYKELCFGNVQNCKETYQLLFIDRNNLGQFNSWYEAFSVNSPLLLSSFNNTQKTICFSKLHVGMDEESIFYQYGFRVPQGPVISALTPALLSDFRQYILQYFNVNSINEHEPLTYTFLHRKFTRKIVNPDYIERSLKKLSIDFFNKTCKIMIIEVATNNTFDILQAVSSSKLIIGMHGAGMILSLFLPLNSVAIELFPYSIKDNIVSPLYALSHVKGVHFKYLSWTNYNKRKTIEHPEYPILLGGISNLALSIQNEIKNVNDVPAVICCNNPLYLFKMFQDTIVDETIVPVLEKSLNLEDLPPVQLLEKWGFPGYVKNFKVTSQGTILRIFWNPPFNVIGKNVKYNLLVYTLIKNISMILDVANLTLPFNKSVTYCEAWISCIENGIEGLDSYARCKN